MAPRGTGYWISPSGEVIRVLDIHISTITRHPDKFGFTSDELSKFYEDAGEPVGSEGKAREKIMLSAMQSGWIRVREWPGRGEKVVFEASRMTKRTVGLIEKFAEEYIKGEIPGGTLGKYTDASVAGLHDGTRGQGSIRQLSDFGLFKHVFPDDIAEGLHPVSLRYLLETSEGMV